MEFYLTYIKNRKTLEDELCLARFIYFAFTTFFKIGTSSKLIKKWGKSEDSKTKKVVSLCNDYKKWIIHTNKNRKYVDVCILFLMIKGVHPSMVAENRSPLNFFESTLRELEKLIKCPNVIDTDFLIVAPLFYDYKSQIDSFKVNNDWTTNDINVLSLIGMVYEVLDLFYGSSDTSEFIQVILDEKKGRRFYELDGFWQTTDTKGKNTNEFWHIKLLTPSMIYLMRKYKVAKSGILEYTDHNLIIKNLENPERVNFMIGSPDLMYRIVKSSKIIYDYQIFECTDSIWDENWSTSKFTLKPLEYDKEKNWIDFSNKTFVRVDNLESKFKRMVNSYILRPTNPKIHVDIINAKLAVTPQAIFVGFYLNSRHKDIVLRFDKYKYDKNFVETIGGIDLLDHTSNIIIAITADNKQYLGLADMYLYIDIDKLLETKQIEGELIINHIHINTRYIKELEFDTTFEELFS